MASGRLNSLAAPPDVASGLMIAVALVGLAGNGASLWLLRSAQAQSLNTRGVFLEVLSDFAGSAAVILAGLVIIFTGFGVVDAIASILIGILIFPRTWRLLRDAVDVLLEATPKGLDMALVRSHILEAPGVTECHDLHVWTITSGMNVVSAHVIAAPDADPAAVLDHLCECLAGFFDIEHSTFQIETADRRRLEDVSATFERADAKPRPPNIPARVGFAPSSGFECRRSIQTNRRHAEREPTGQEADDPDEDEWHAEPPQILTHGDRANEPERRADHERQGSLAR